MGFRFSQPQGLCASILYLCGWLLTSGAIDAAQAQAVVCGVHCVAPVANQGTGQGAAGTSTLIGQLFGGGSTGGVDGYWGGGSTGGVDGYRPGGGLGIRLSGGGGTGGVYGFAPFDLDQSAKASNNNPLASLASVNPSNNAPPIIQSGPIVSTRVIATGDIERRSAIDSADIGRKQTSAAGVASLQAAWLNALTPGDSLTVGAAVSYVSSQIDYDLVKGGPTGASIRGPGVGLYSNWINGHFNSSLVGLYQTLESSQGYSVSSRNFDIGIKTAGLSGKTGYRFESGPFLNNASRVYFLEPLARYDFVRTMFDGSGAQYRLQDASTLQLGAGLKVGTSFISPTNQFITASVTGLVYDNVISQSSSALAANNAGILIPNDQGRVRGEIAPMLEITNVWGLSQYVRGSVRFGEELVGYALTGGLRTRW